MTINRDALVETIASRAEAWRDPDYPPRVRAVDRAIKGDNRFTEEAIAFAVNQQMASLQREALSNWVEDCRLPDSRKVAVFHREAVPLEELRSWLAVVLLGGRFIGVYTSEPPPLLRSFAEDVQKRYTSISQSYVSSTQLKEDPSAVIAIQCNNSSLVRQYCHNERLPCLYRENQYSVALLTGNESEEDRMDLAEDVLLHEGMGVNNVRIILAPEDLDPDPYLEAFAIFRGVFPVHVKTPVSLKMRKAFLAAHDIAHAYGEGLEFLVSKGPAEIQESCHIRWTPYTYSGLSDVFDWLEMNSGEIRFVVSHNQRFAAKYTSIPFQRFGKMHRLGLNEDPHSRMIVDFLSEL